MIENVALRSEDVFDDGFLMLGRLKYFILAVAV
jgi:hypothetical protein